jgi:ATP-dependent RNA helicase RhlE
VPEDYVHRIGRTGRAGCAGQALSLVASDERDRLRAIERVLGRRIDVLPLDRTAIAVEHSNRLASHARAVSDHRARAQDRPPARPQHGAPREQRRGSGGRRARRA